MPAEQLSSEFNAADDVTSVVDSPVTPEDINAIANDADVVAAWDSVAEPGDGAESGQSTGEAAEAGDDAPASPASNAAASDEPAAGGETATSDDAAASTTPAAPWFTDADVAAAEQRGLSEYDLYEYESRDDFRKALRVADAALAHASKQTPSPPAPATPTTPSPEPLDESAIDEPELPDGRINPSYFEKNYDKAVAKMAQVMRQEQDAKIKQAADSKQAQEVAQAAAVEADLARRFDELHDMLDADDPELFGVSMDADGNTPALAKEFAQRRAAMFNRIDDLRFLHARDQQRRGLPVSVPSQKHFLAKAKKELFAEILAQREQAAHKGRVQEQAGKIRPAAGSTGASYARTAPTNRTDSVHGLASDADVRNAFAAAGIN